MPFTLSHPAAALPLAQLLGKRVVWSALVIGCIAPDLPYYFGNPWPRATTHSLASVFWFSVPAGLVAYALFQLVLRRPAVFLLPELLRRRLDPQPRWAPVSWVLLSLVLGALTHVAWDAITHGTGAFVVALPSLRLHAAEAERYAVWTYTILQHGSTILGAAALLHALARWIRRTPARMAAPESPRVARLRGPARLVAGLFPGVMGLGVGFVLAPPALSPGSLAWFLVHVVVAGIATLTLVVSSLGLVLARSSRHDTPDAASLERLAR